MTVSGQLLTDEQVARFIVQGYLVLNNDIPQALHDSVRGQIHKVLSEEGNPGNNILPRVPDIRRFFETPVVKGALTGILGPDYYLHPHRHCHYNRPADRNPGGGGWHKDGYWSAMRSHRPWWAMIFYYTQDVTEELGPTAIMPGSQYSEKFPGDDRPFVLPTGPAGTMVLVHFDLWHRASLNVSKTDRYMLKFQFARTAAPAAPAWDNRASAFPLPAGSGETLLLPLWNDVWRWLRGEREAVTDTAGGENAGEAAALAAAGLDDTSEETALAAAYRLAGMGEEGVHRLAEALTGGSRPAAARAAYGLAATGPAAIGVLRTALAHADERRRALAAFALGMIGETAAQAEADLIGALRDGSEWVRRNAAEALGQLLAPSPAAVSALAGALREAVRGEGEAPAEGTADAYSPNQRYIANKIAYTAALSLLRIGRHGDVGEVVEALEAGMDSADRYVRAYAFEALTQLPGEAAAGLLIRRFRTARWCPDTTPSSLF